MYSRTYDILTKEAKDSSGSYALYFIMAILSLLYMIFLVITNYFYGTFSETQNTQLWLSLFAFITSVTLIFLESRFENTKYIGAVLFKDLKLLMIAVVLGTFAAALASNFLGSIFCSEQRYIDEGFCVIKDGTKSFTVSAQSIGPGITYPLYIIGLAPFVEESIFRVLLFYSILAIARGLKIEQKLASTYLLDIIMLPILLVLFAQIFYLVPDQTTAIIYSAISLGLYWFVMRGWLQDNPQLPVFLFAAVITNASFGLFHYFARLGVCVPPNLRDLGSMTLEQFSCLYDNIFVAQIFGFLFLFGNMYLGLGFSLAGHSFVNAISIGWTPTMYLTYVLVPFLILAALIYYGGKKKT